MKRSQPRTALTDAIAAAIERFQADIQRVARAARRHDLASPQGKTEKGPGRAVAPGRALVAGERTPPRARKAAAAGTKQPARATQTGTLATPQIASERSAPTHSEREAVAVTQVEPKSRGQLSSSSRVVALAPAVMPEAQLGEGRGSERKEDRAQRRSERQERARIRRDTAEIRARSAGGAQTPTESLAVPSIVEPMRADAPATDDAPNLGPRMRRGIVKWFNSTLGYGFIKSDDGGDAFVHQSAIVVEGFRALCEGQIVSYQEVDSPKGVSAQNVVPLR